MRQIDHDRQGFGSAVSLGDGVKITASGWYAGRQRSLTWAEPGELSGDPGLCELFRYRIAELEGEYIGPPEGGGRSTDQMGWPGAFVWVARDVLARCEFTGDLDDLNDAYSTESFDLRAKVLRSNDR